MSLKIFFSFYMKTKKTFVRELVKKYDKEYIFFSGKNISL